MEKNVLSYIPLLLLFCISIQGWTQQPQVDGDSFSSKKADVVSKLTSISYVDLQNAVNELNSIRFKMDELTESGVKQCQAIVDKSQNIECFSKRRSDLKEIWVQYFSSKEKYLKLLYESFLMENSKQSKITLDSIDALQGAKNRR